MSDKTAAERACKDPNPVIDGRKANVNLAYIGAKPRIMQTTGDSYGRLLNFVLYLVLNFYYTFTLRTPLNVTGRNC